MTKGEARRTAREGLRRHLAHQSVAARAAAAAMLAAHVEHALDGATLVAAYLPLADEIDTVPLLGRLEARGVTLALPQLDAPDAPLRFRRWRPGDALVRGVLGFRQPEASAKEVAPELVLTPLVAFDRALHRLGRGAGHYDRAFARLPAARRIGLAWSVQLLASVPTDPWDVPLHAVATEAGLLEATA